MGFLDSLDIANRVMQHCGTRQIASPTEDSKRNQEVTFAYDKLRKAELRRNNWRFAIKNVLLRAVDTNTMMLVPALYDSTKTYLPGAIVSDANNQLWVSMTKQNINNTPGGNNEVWDAYFGPRTITAYDSTLAYFAGELVYLPGLLNGSYVIYQSLKNDNTDVPNVVTAWSAATQYNGNSVVSNGGYQWSSLIELNLNITPAVGPTVYDNTATYSAAQTVTGSDNFIYSSVAGGNIGHDPVTDGGVHWTNTGVANAWSRLAASTSVASTNWRVIDAQMNNLSFSYPLGSGPVSNTDTLNVFCLPAGFLKEAPQDPKAGSVSFLGAPSARPYDDWLYQGNYFTSRDAGPILYRFIADVMKVSDMDDMFCEGLAARIATAVCEPLTQSNEKLQTIASEYKLFMGEARIANAIEIGPIEPPEDDFIGCRL